MRLGALMCRMAGAGGKGTHGAFEKATLASVSRSTRHITLCSPAAHETPAQSLVHYAIVRLPPTKAFHLTISAGSSSVSLTISLTA